jgi:hypothetical protein
MTVIKIYLKKQARDCKLDYSRWGQMVIFCENGNGPLGSIEFVEILDQPSDYRLPKKDAISCC